MGDNIKVIDTVNMNYKVYIMAKVNSKVKVRVNEFQIQVQIKLKAKIHVMIFSW